MNLLSGITGKSVIFVFLGVYPIVDNFARTSTLRRKESTPKRQYKNLSLGLCLQSVLTSMSDVSILLRIYVWRVWMKRLVRPARAM